MATVKPAAALAVLILGHLVTAVLGQTCVDDQQTALCIQDQYDLNGGNGNLQCTANDLSDATLEITAIQDSCDGTSGTATFTAELTVTATAAQIFDIGLFIPTDGQGNARNGECEVYVFQCQEDPDDGDSCGDVSQGSTTFNPIEIELGCDTILAVRTRIPFPTTALVPCTAEQEVEFCVAWAVGVGQQPTDECIEPSDATPSTPAKCVCGTFSIPQCPTIGASCKEPILQGLRGQYIKWVGEEGAWYALFLDEAIDTQVNVRSTGPLPEEFPDRQFVTGVSILSQGHSLVFEVINPYSGETPGCPNGIFPCLVDGGIRIIVDGEESSALLNPTRDEKIADTFEVSSSNLPTECREFGGGREWAHVYSERRRGQRELAELSFENWVMSFPHMVAADWCAKYISESGLADVQSKQAVIRISTPDITVRFSVGVNHRYGGRKDRFGRELPALDFWQTSVALIGVDSKNEHLTGMLGETARPVRDKNGHVINKGLDALRGTVADYRVSGPLGVDFTLLHE